MKRPYDIGKEPGLHKIVIISAVIHLLFITFAGIPVRLKQREFRTFHVKLVGSVRVPARAVAVKERPSSVVKGVTTDPGKGIKETTSKKNAQLTDRRTDMSLERAEKVKREIERLRAISSLAKRKAGRGGSRELEVLRKEIRERASGMADSGEEVPGEADPYYALITERIWSHWVYPDIEAQGLETIITIKISREGNILGQDIEKSSGNRLFDRSALNALSKASPLPPPPEEMEIGVRFYL